MSRRIGQTGQRVSTLKEWNPAAPAYGRFWIDVPGAQRKRRTVRLVVCRTRERRHGVNSANTSKPKASTQIKPLHQPQHRRQRFAYKPKSGFRHFQRGVASRSNPPRFQGGNTHWINGCCRILATLLLADVGNAALKGLIEKMFCAGLSPQTIVTHSKLVKMVVASAVNSDGEQIHPRKWNHDFIGLPIVDTNKQHRPTVTETELREILASTKERYAVLFALLAGTGLRIGEAVGLKSTDFASDCRVLHVRRSIWHGQEQQPKTPNAVREVDIAEPLSRLLREYVNGKSGYLFAAASGRPLQQRNVLRTLHATGKKIGFHAFRRFRTETLRRARVPEDLIKLWLGHAKSTVTDFYASGLSKDIAWRREWCDRVGLGFQWGYDGLQNVVRINSAKVV